jgi:nucleoside-diphosphate-sugar epimerase
MATYLVTGGAGFIGSNLVQALLASDERDPRVRVLDNFSTGKRENLAGLSGDLEVIEGDLTDLSTVQATMSGVDYVLHQAAIPSVQRSVKDPLATDRANVLGTLNVLWAAKEAAVKRVVYAASSSAYGEAIAPKKSESMPARPLSPYGVSKLAGELYCAAFTNVYGLETVALRYFNVFGPRQDANSEYSAVIPRFISALLAGRQPVIYGDGEQTRDFTYIANVVDGNLRALTAPGAAGQMMNLAAGGRVSLNTLARTLGDILGVPATPTYAAARPGDIRDSSADISRAQDILGYTPRVDLRTGLEATIGWLRQRTPVAA